MLFCNGFSVELSKFEPNIERRREKDVEHSFSTLFLQLTQVLMSRIVGKLLTLPSSGNIRIIERIVTITKDTNLGTVKTYYMYLFITFLE